MINNTAKLFYEAIRIRLEEKTSWGRNELKQMLADEYQRALESALASSTTAGGL